MKKKIAYPHDSLFKSAMKDIRVAREFFETYLPAEILHVIDLNHLKLSPNTYVDEALLSSESDILYETRIHDDPAYLFFLAEHQSTPDKLLPYRLLKYMICVWEDHLKQHKEEKLPLIVQVVFYHGRQPYTYTRDIRDLISAPRALTDKLLFAPFHLVDTHDIPDEKLREQQWFGTMAFFMKHSFERDFLPYLQQILSVLQRLEQAEGGSTYVTSLLNYLLTTTEINVEKLIETVKEGLSTSTGEKIMTAAEQLIEQGKRYGIEQGMQQGMQQGKLEGEQIMLMKLLHRRFPSLKPAYEELIKHAQAEELLLWGERILYAKSLEEVFQG